MKSGQLFHRLVCLILLTQIYNKHIECAPTSSTFTDTFNSAQVPSHDSGHSEDLSIQTNKESWKPIPNNDTSSSFSDEESSEENKQPRLGSTTRPRSFPKPSLDLVLPDPGPGVFTDSSDEKRIPTYQEWGRRSRQPDTDLDYHEFETRRFNPDYGLDASREDMPIDSQIGESSSESEPLPREQRINNTSTLLNEPDLLIPILENHTNPEHKLLLLTLVKTYTFIIDIIPTNDSLDSNETSSDSQDSYFPSPKKDPIFGLQQPFDKSEERDENGDASSLITQERNKRADFEILILPNPEPPAVLILNEDVVPPTTVTLTQDDNNGTESRETTTDETATDDTIEPHALVRRSSDLAQTSATQDSSNSTADVFGPGPVRLHQVASGDSAETSQADETQQNEEPPYVPIIGEIIPKPRPKTGSSTITSAPTSNVPTPTTANHEKSQSPNTPSLLSQRDRRNVFLSNSQHTDTSHVTTPESDEEYDVDFHNSSSTDESQEGNGQPSRTVLIVLFLGQNNESNSTSGETETSTPSSIEEVKESSTDASAFLISSRKKRDVTSNATLNASTSNSTAIETSNAPPTPISPTGNPILPSTESSSNAVSNAISSTPIKTTSGASPPVPESASTSSATDSHQIPNSSNNANASNTSASVTQGQGVSETVTGGSTVIIVAPTSVPAVVGDNSSVSTASNVTYASSNATQDKAAPEAITGVAISLAPEPKTAGSGDNSSASSSTNTSNVSSKATEGQGTGTATGTSTVDNSSPLPAAGIATARSLNSSAFSASSGNTSSSSVRIGNGSVAVISGTSDVSFNKPYCRE